MQTSIENAGARVSTPGHLYSTPGFGVLWRQPQGPRGRGRGLLISAKWIENHRISVVNWLCTEWLSVFVTCKWVADLLCSAWNKNCLCNYIVRTLYIILFFLPCFRNRPTPWWAVTLVSVTGLFITSTTTAWTFSIGTFIGSFIQLQSIQTCVICVDCQMLISKQKYKTFFVLL